MSNAKVAVVKTENLKANEALQNHGVYCQGEFVRYDEDIAIVRAAVKKCIELTIGSIDKLVKPGDRVLLKPNIVSGVPPEGHVTTDPRVIEAVVAFLKEESQAGEVWIGDNTGIRYRAEACVENAFKVSGAYDASIRGGIDKIMYFDEMPTVAVHVPLAKVFKDPLVFAPVMAADVVINLPIAKTHISGILTLGMKNWQGIVPYGHPSKQQEDCHRADLGQKIADLYRIRKPDLTIIDCIFCMEGDGPTSGTGVEMNLLIASTDTVAADAVTAYIMGVGPDEVHHLRIAGTEGLGEVDLNKIEVLGVPKESVRKHIKRPNGNPVGMFKGFDVCSQQTCPGCYENIKGSLALFKNSGIDPQEFIEKAGECMFIGGGVPSLEPRLARGRNLWVVGDCWKLFPSREKVEEAIETAKWVRVYPGCAPMYIWGQINIDLMTLADEFKVSGFSLADRGSQVI